MRSITNRVAVGIFVAGLVLAPMGARAAVSDSWITAKAKIALMTTKGVSSSAVNVDTVDGVVTLHGKVNSPEEKARAEEEVKKINGVKEVRNLLQVVPERQQKIVKSSDKEIKERVEKAIKQNPDLKNSGISVQSVNDGVVLLGGKADTVAQHLAAVDAARSVPGVRKVESEIQSPDRLADAEIRRQPASPTAGTKRGIGQTAKDMWITSDVKMRLLANDKTPANDVNVDTRNGVVTLFGMVPSQEAKAAAEAEARKVNGVTRVVNELEVVPKARKETVEARDDQLKDEISKRLQSRDDLKGASIDVDVKNGVARLTGTVDNDEQRLAAALAARSVPGVRAVRQDLRVKS